MVHNSEKLQLYNVKKYLKNITDKIASYDVYNAPKMPENTCDILYRCHLYSKMMTSMNNGSILKSVLLH